MQNDSLDKSRLVANIGLHWPGLARWQVQYISTWADDPTVGVGHQDDFEPARVETVVLSAFFQSASLPSRVFSSFFSYLRWAFS